MGGVGEGIFARGGRGVGEKVVELTGQPKKLFCVVSPSAAATLSPLRPPCSSPHCAGCFPPAPASPHSPALLAPLRRARLKPPLGRPLARPLRGLPCPVPQGAALRAAVDDPRSASRRSGDGRPRFGHSPAAGAAWRGLRRGLAIPRPAVIPTHFVVGIHGRAPGGTRSHSLARLAPRALPSAFTRACARLRQVRRLPDGPREERRRPARLPAAPENLPQGSAPRNGAASARARLLIPSI